MPGIAVLDSGGQYCHLIARRVREFGVFSQILPLDISASELQNFDGIIISGGPHSVYEHDAPRVRTEILELGKPVLGICYGQQLMAQLLGGEVRQGNFREYGTASLTILESDTIFSDVPTDELVWMSHGDAVQKLPSGFQTLAQTENCPFAAIANFKKRIYGLQFHPEVTHTKYGPKILQNFLFGICHAEKNWDPAQLKEKLIGDIRKLVAGRKVYFLVSGGVDSTVAYTLCAKALPEEDLEGLYVDTGFMRKNESDQLRLTFKKLDLPNINIIDASNQFLNALEKIVDPERKRNLIGQLFFNVQEKIVESLECKNKNWMLGQGTIYPDTVESGGTPGSAVIKTHHNRVLIISELGKQGRLVEPLRELYKDEVRELGRSLGLPEDLISRHPFPGPGLAIRTLCANGEARPQSLKGVTDLCRKHNIQGCTLPLRSVGVQGDSRSYADIAIVAGKANLETLSEVSTEITNCCVDVNRVVYCLDTSVDLNTLRIHEAFLIKERVDLLREADAIAHQILEDSGLAHRVWQFPVVLIPVSRKESFGEDSVVLRPVYSVDGMTAEFAKLPLSLLSTMAKQILTLRHIDLVFFDISNKPPATIEWE